MSIAHLLRRPGLWIAVAAVIGGAAYLGVHALGPRVHTVVASRQDLEQHLIASGRVWVPTRVQVSAQSPGRVLAVAVVEGAHVKAGDLLVQLDDAEARADVAQAEATVRQAGARASQLRQVGAVVADAALRQADENGQHTQADLDRQRRLVAAGAAAQVDVENARTARNLALAQRRGALAQQISSAPRGADSLVALTAVREAQAQLAIASVKLAQTRISALQDAVVLSRTVEPGDMVPASRTLLVLAAGADQPELVFQFDERNLGAIRLGQVARASADAYPTQVFDAVVSHIAPSIDPDRGSIEVRLKVPSPPRPLLPDMTVSVDLTVASRKQALTLPGAAVRGAATAAPWLLLVEGGRVVRREVSLGIRGEGTIEIASALGDHAAAILPDGQLLKVGQRVRPSR